MRYSEQTYKKALVELARLNAVAYWNTRAPILSAEEMERLEATT